MEPWLAANVSQEVRGVCEELVANNPDLKSTTIAYGRNTTNEDWRAIGEALKRNTTLTSIRIGEPSAYRLALSTVAANSLALGIVSHLSLVTLTFDNIKFTDFGAIMMAIIQNPKLCKVEILCCVMSPSVEQSLSFLLKENALKLLELDSNVEEDDDWDDSDNHVLNIQDAFRHNHSLNVLDVLSSDGGEVITCRTLEDIALMLRRNQSIERLSLSCAGIGNPSNAISAILLEARGHVSLKRLEIVDCNVIDKNATDYLTGLLATPSVLEELDLSNCRLGDKGVEAIANGLRSENCSLKKLDLFQTGFGGAGVSSIAEALEKNSSLVEINLSRNDFGDQGPKLLESLEKNMSLHHCDLSGERFQELGKRFMALNRGGRKILGSHDVPRSLWPYILAKSSKIPDVVYYFLQQKPDLFKKQETLLGKRKRGVSSPSRSV